MTASLVSWVGNADINGGTEEVLAGPLASVLRFQPFQFVYLLHNQSSDLVHPLVSKLKGEFDAVFTVIHADIQSPTYLVQRVARLRTISSIYTEYIYSCIQLKAFEKHCCPTETTVPHISPVELKSFEIPLPDDVMVRKYHEVVSKTRASINSMRSGDLLGGDAFKSLSQRGFPGGL